MTIVSKGWRRIRRRITEIRVRTAIVRRRVYHRGCLNAERLGRRLAVPGDRRWVCERLNPVWVKREIIEVRHLKAGDREIRLPEYEIQHAYLIELFHEFRVLIRDMLLNKRGGLEELLASLAPEPALVFLLDVLLNCFAQFPATRMTFPVN